MLSWGVIAYGAALSAVLAVLLVLLAGVRAPAVLVAVAVGAFAGPVAWNAILWATAANEFFVDAPIPVFPVNWQDTGSSVFALAALASSWAWGRRAPAPAIESRCSARSAR